MMSPTAPQFEAYGGGRVSPFTETQTPANTATTITLKYTPFLNPDEALPNPFELHKNGLLLNPNVDYTLAGNVVTLTVAANGTDVFQAGYWYSTGQ